MEQAKGRAAASLVHPVGKAFQPDLLEPIGEGVPEFAEQHLQKYPAQGTARSGQEAWDCWSGPMKGRGQVEHFLPEQSEWEQLDYETTTLSWLGDLATEGFAPGTLRQPVVAVQSRHVRAGAGGPLANFDGVGIFLDALTSERAPLLRKQGVTAGMMKWTAAKPKGGNVEEVFDIPEPREPPNQAAADAAAVYGFFLLARTSE